MPTIDVNQNTSEVIITVQCNGAWSDFNASQTVFMQRSERNYLPERRVYPTGPLWQSPTAREAVYKQLLIAPKYELRSYGERNQCGNNYGSCYSEMVDWVTMGTLFRRPPTPNWQLKLALEVKNRRINLASDIAELDETLKPVLKGMGKVISLGRQLIHCRKLPAAKRLRCLSRTLKRDISRKEAFNLRDVSGTHLALSFGVLPVMGVVYDSMERLKETLRNRALLPIRFTVTERLDEQQPDALNPWALVRLDAPKFHKSHTKVTVRAVAVMKAGFDLNFTPGNPLEAGYELIPFSFVVDWFIGIGDWLSTIDAWEGVQSITGTVTTRQFASWEQRCPPWANNLGHHCEPLGRVISLARPAKAIRTDYQRDLLTSFPPLPPFPKLQGPGKSLMRLANATALLHQLRSQL